MSYAGKWDYTILTTKSKADGRKLMMPHQQEAVDALNKYFDLSGRTRQEQSGLLIMPTGSGKTFTTITWLMESAIPAGYRVIWFAHRQELVDQATREFCNVAPILAEHGIKKVKILPISGQHAGMSQSCGYDINVCSIRSAATKNGRRFIRRMLGTPGARKVVVIIDEAHHAPMKSYQDVLDTIRGINPSMILLGLTATPKRLEGNHLLMEMFNVEQNRKKRGNGFIYEVSLQHLIQYEYLATPHYIPVNTEIQGDTAYHLTEKSVELFHRFGELPEDIFNEIANSAARNKCIVDHYVKNKEKYGKTLVFAIKKEHARKLYEEFSAANISCNYVVSGMPNSHEIIEDFRQNKFDVLINVQMMTEGSDVPDIQTAFMTRETNSDSLFMQMVGRALRGSYAGGTKDAYIVDFHDKWEMLHFWFKPEGLDIFTTDEHDEISDIAIEEENTQIANADDEGVDNTETFNNEEENDDEIPLEKLREIYREISKSIESHWEASIDLPRWPVGWYAIPDKPAVLVLNDQLEAYQDLQKYLDSVLDEKRNSKFIQENYFVECTHPADIDIDNILSYAKHEQTLPPYYELAEQDAADPHYMAQRVLEKYPDCVDDLNGRAIYWLCEQYESSKRIQSLYPQFVSFRRAVENILSSRHRADIIETDERKTYHLIPDYYDLEELADEVYVSYPSLKSAFVTIQWSDRVVKSWFGITHRLSADTYKIRINRLLSSPDVSRETIKYLLYHELLHANGLWTHSDTFRNTEWEYPNSAQLDGELDSLALRYQLDYEELKKRYKGSSTITTVEGVGFEEVMGTSQVNEQRTVHAVADDYFNPKAAGVVDGYKYCQNCGHRLLESARFCDKCGRPAIYY